MKKENNKVCHYGIWFGKDATYAAIDDFSIAFLRLKKDLIASILKYGNYGTVGCVYGLGINYDARAIYCVKDLNTGVKYCNIKDGAENLEKHSEDTVIFKENEDIVYKMYNGKTFELKLAESIDLNEFYTNHPVDNSLSIAKRMELWCQKIFFNYGSGYIDVDIDTKKYSICFHVSDMNKRVYCRVGQNGFCEKGRAMLSTTCIRQNECRMIENNLQAMEEFKPVEDYFIDGSCAFPPDGGWYWSVQKVTDDVIYLNGCSGATYEIRRA